MTNCQRLESARVLIVDDHAVVRRGIRALLERFPEWEICGEASNGIEAIECNRQLKPDLIVMDISMPQLNGLEASRQILQETPQTEILLITLLSSEDLLEIALSYGIHGYVLKSEAEQDLVDGLRAIREHRIYVSPALNRSARPRVHAEGHGS